jgi:acyl carrier protein
LQQIITAPPEKTLVRALRATLYLRDTPGPIADVSNKELLGMNVSRLGFDSIETLGLFMALEDALDLVLDERAFIECTTVLELLEWIRSAS